MVTLANPNICDKMLKKSILPPYYRTGDSAGDKIKSGVKEIYILAIPIYKLYTPPTNVVIV